LPGHGRSQHRSPDGEYHFVDWVGDVWRVADALGWERFTLLGHSMGGAISCLFAGTFPERVERLVTIEGLSPLTSEPEDAPARLARAVVARQAVAGKRLPVYPTLEAALAARAAAGDFAAAELAKGIVERGTKPVDGGLTWRSDPRLKLESALRMGRPQVLAFLARIACPVLGVRASRGIAIDPKMLEVLTGRMQSLQVVTVDGGHHVHLERPDEVAARVAAFLAAG
jgi:pimeloyl-ACP methyl ester carboxylesterase